MATLSFNDTIFAQEALKAFTAKLAPLRAFSRSLNGDAARVGDTIIVPFISAATATTFNATTANYQTAGGAVTHNTLSVNQHNIVNFDISDLQNANSSAARFDEMAAQAGRALGDKVLQNIWKLITTTNFGSASITTLETNYTLASLIEFRKVLAGRNVDVDPGVCSFIHNTVVGATLLGTANVLNAYQIGDSQAARQGTLGQLVGFPTYETNILPTAATSLVAFACHPDAVNVAMRYLMPLAGGEYLAVERAVDPSGIVMGYRRSYDQATGIMYGAFECLYGTATGLTLGLVHGTKP
tara:strand:+ start:2840 stop:3733 length:894 start_codon:yes stop_codon:yes gene_type:complete